MNKRHFPVIVEQDEDGVFLVECPMFDGCRSYGNTLDDALENIREAIELCLDEVDESEPSTVFLGVRDLELAL